MSLLPLLLLAGPAFSQAQGPTYRNIGQGVYTFAGDGLLYTSVFVVTTDGVVVLDPMSTTHATQMLAAIREVSDQPVSYVAYSHNHWDHTGGAAVFNPRNIIAHKKAAAWIAANPKADGSVVPPTITWSGREKTIQVGNQTIEMKHLGVNHGQGWTAFILKQQRIAYMTDLTFIGSLVADGQPSQLARTLKDILALPGYDTVVASHSGQENINGELTRDYVQTALDFIVDLRAEVQRQLGLVTSAADAFNIPTRVDLPKYQDREPYKTFLIPAAWNVLSEDVLVGPFGKSGIPEGNLVQSSSGRNSASPSFSSSNSVSSSNSPRNSASPRLSYPARDRNAWKSFFAKNGR